MARKLNDWLTAYMAYTAETESSRIFNKWVGLSAIASCLRRKVWFNFGRIKLCSNMFVVLVAEPGTARKTQAIGYAEDLLAEIPGVIISADCMTPQALIDDLEKAKMDDQLPNGEMFPHNSLSIISGEFESFIGSKKENSRMITALTDFFDCKTRPFKYRTKHSGSNVVDAVFLNLLAATTPDSLANALPYTAIGGGLTSRIIFIWNEGKGKKVDVPEWSQELEDLKCVLIHDLSIISRIAGGYDFTTDSRAWWRDWYMSFDEKDKNRICKDPAFNGWYARKPTFIIKLAQIVSASESSVMNITTKGFERSVTIIEEAEIYMSRTFSAIGRSTVTADVDLVIQVVKQHKVISEKTLMHIIWRDVDSNKFDNVMGTVLKAGFVKRYYKGPKGEPGIWYAWEPRE